MAAATKKTIKLEEVRAEQLKKAIKDIETISDTYQKTHLRLILVQAINGMSQTTVEDIPEGREALETNTKKKQTKSKKAQETVEKAQEAIEKVNEAYSEEETQEEVISEEEQAQIDAQEDMVAEGNLGADDAEVQGVTIELEGEDGPIEFDVTESYVALANVPDDDNKKLLAYYLLAYDADSVNGILEAFSSGLAQQEGKDVYAFLNADNYEAFLQYFNDCLQA